MVLGIYMNSAILSALHIFFEMVYGFEDNPTTTRAKLGYKKEMVEFLIFM